MQLWVPQVWESQIITLNISRSHLCLVYLSLKRSEAMLLSLVNGNCLKHLTIIANKQCLPTWSKLFYLYSFMFSSSSIAFVTFFYLENSAILWIHELFCFYLVSQCYTTSSFTSSICFKGLCVFFKELVVEKYH